MSKYKFNLSLEDIKSEIDINKINRYIKKPIEVEAMVFTYPMSQEFINWLGDSLGSVQKKKCIGECFAEAEIKTLEDGENLKVKHIATEGDFIVRGVDGEFYPCKPDIFEQTFEIKK